MKAFACEAIKLAWRTVLAAVLALPAMAQQTSSATATNPPPAPRRPNIILIVADDLGYGDLGCYGQTKIQTPNLDKLAAEGVRFTRFYAGSTVCAPSRCSLMTGLHTGHARIRGNAKVALRDEDITVAEVLKQAGYRTGLVGKWGLGNEGTSGVPQKQGFEEFVGYLDQTHAHDYYTDKLWRYDFRTGYDGMSVFPENQSGKKGLYIHDLFTVAALNFIRINKPEPVNRFRPFFLYLAYTIPHANNEENRASGQGMQVPSDAPYSQQPWPQPEKNKAAMITRMDTDIGKIMELLKTMKIDETTVVIFTSDNGPHKEGSNDPKFFQSSGPFRGIKRDLYEGGIRVPMIVRWPERVRAGRTSDQVWAMWDFLPTAAEIAMTKPPPALDGISMLPAITGHTQTNQHEFLYWEFHERGFQQAIRSGNWKGIVNELGKPMELYDLKADPGEQKDVASENSELVEQLTARLKTARTESEDWPIKPPKKKQQ